MKQGKGRSVVIKGRNKYFDKCLVLLNPEQFVKLTQDPTATTERKVQRILRKIKQKLPKEVYQKLYLTGSSPGKFYGTAKIHKLPPNQGIDNLPLRPVISNINTATYELAHYIAQVLSPFSQSDYTVSSNKEFTKIIKLKSIPDNYKLVSFDVMSLFTNVSLDSTIDIILNRIYDKKELATNIERKDMTDVILLWTKNVRLTFNNNIFKQTDGVAMGSPLDPVLAGIIMVELKNTMVPRLSKHIYFWRRYVDDTFTFVKEESITFVLEQLNSYHPNLQFTYELENAGKLSFLDILVIRQKNNRFETTVYRKNTNTDIYLNWLSHAPNTWKRGTLKVLINRAYTLCSTDYHLKEELRYLEKVFVERNNYPRWLVKQMMKKVLDEQTNRNVPNVTINLPNEDSHRSIKTPLISLPYKGKQGENVIRSLRNTLDKILPQDVEPKFIYTGTKLSTKFQIKDKTKDEHKHDLVYYGKCPECDESYVGETGRRLQDRVDEHSGKDSKSNILRNSCQENDKNVSRINFQFLGNEYKKMKFKWKLFEALYIKELHPSLNTREISVALKLF